MELKFFPAVDLRWSNAADGSSTIPAMPFLEQLLADPCHIGVLNTLRAIPLNQYNNSLVVIRDVRRIPLKLDSQTALDADEAEHIWHHPLMA